MSIEEIRLEALKLAVDQTRREATTSLERVAELQTWFYNRIVNCDANATEAVPKGNSSPRKAKAADKSPEIFG